MFAGAIRYFFQALSLETTSASTVAFVCSLAVVVVSLGGLVMPRKDDGTSATEAWYLPLLPALLAAAGVGSLELGGTEAPGVGDLLALGQVRREAFARALAQVRDLNPFSSGPHRPAHPRHHRNLLRLAAAVLRLRLLPHRASDEGLPRAR